MLQQKRGGLSTITIMSITMGILVAVLFLNFTSYAGSEDKITNLYFSRDVGLLLDTTFSISNDLFFQIPRSVDGTSIKIDGNMITTYGEDEIQSQRQTFAVSTYYFTRAKQFDFPLKKTVQIQNLTIEKKGSKVYLYDAYEQKLGVIVTNPVPATSQYSKKQVNLHVESKSYPSFTQDQKTALKRLEGLLETRLRDEGFEVNETKSSSMKIIFTLIEDTKTKIYYGSADESETKPLAQWTAQQTFLPNMPHLTYALQKSSLSTEAYIEIAFPSDQNTLIILNKEPDQRLIISYVVGACEAFYK